MKNKSRIEGSICEAFLAKEVFAFCFFYFETHVESHRTRVRRNDERAETLSYVPTYPIFILERVAMGAGSEYWLEKKKLCDFLYEYKFHI